MGNPQNVPPRSVWRGSQTPQRLLDTPRSVRRGTKILNQENVTPEVRLEVVRNAVTTFSTTPKVCPAVSKRWIPLWTPPRSVLVNDENGTDPNPSVARGPSLRYAENGQRANPAYSRGPSLRFRKCPWGKNGRGPEGDLKPYCKNPESGKLQYPERLPRGQPEAVL